MLAVGGLLGHFFKMYFHRLPTPWCKFRKTAINFLLQTLKITFVSRKTSVQNITWRSSQSWVSTVPGPFDQPPDIGWSWNLFRPGGIFYYKRNKKCRITIHPDIGIHVSRVNGKMSPVYRHIYITYTYNHVGFNMCVCISLDDLCIYLHNFAHASTTLPTLIDHMGSQNGAPQNLTVSEGNPDILLPEAAVHPLISHVSGYTTLYHVIPFS